jgi:hypothetical protein
MPDPAELWLCQLPGITAMLVQRLLGAFGSASAIIRAPSTTLRGHGVPPALVARIVAGQREVPQVAAGLKGWQRLGILPLPLAAPTYPERFRDLYMPPLVVYVQGPWPIEQSLVLVAPPGELDDKLGPLWATFVREAQTHIGFASLAPELADDVAPPQILGVPYSLMLARQRLPQAVMQHVSNGRMTLLSTTPPTMRQGAEIDPAIARELHRVLIALCDAVVLVAPLVSPMQEIADMARNGGKATFAFGAASRQNLPDGIRRLRPGKAAVRTLLTLLGIRDTFGKTVQQERLF